ncbi:hypothetical protein E2C01_064876 [Portunus trituberculatus]|uniref:Uncharacterized protein n=1 Tax=Portunus trituberculatus TaxID=210409 RepID=A0A5B7HHD6_PORTR|nr:hypothetical protein [Portunus trituberculatus]
MTTGNKPTGKQEGGAVPHTSPRLATPRCTSPQNTGEQAASLVPRLPRFKSQVVTARHRLAIRHTYLLADKTHVLNCHSPEATRISPLLTAPTTTDGGGGDGGGGGVCCFKRQKNKGRNAENIVVVLLMLLVLFVLLLLVMVVMVLVVQVLCLCL